MNDMTSSRLTADEPLSPDECAWQFLRASQRYKEAFHVAAKRSPGSVAERAIADHLSPRAGPCIAVADREICAREFGLAAFVDPKQASLPPLISKGSWFYPLSRPVHARYLDKEISRPSPRANQWIPLRIDEGFVNLETPFGFLVPKSVQPDIGHVRTANVEWLGYEEGRMKRKVHYVPIPHHAFLLSVVVDCSVPPDGQMSSFGQLAKSLRKDLQQSARITSHAKSWRVDPITSCDAFSDIDLGETRRTPPGVKDTASLWRVVTVDVLGSLTAQIRNCMKALREVYRQHAIGWIDRFPRSIPRLVGSRAASAADKSYMKLLVTLAHHEGLTSYDGEDDSIVVHEIAKSLGLNKGHHKSDFDLGPHLRKTQELIEGDYKMLVHGQVGPLPKP